MQRRQKASDVFSETMPVFGRKTSFEQAFPSIKDVRVHVDERGHGPGFHAGLGPSVYTKTMLREFVDCSNPMCYNGGFSIGSILRDMVTQDETEHTATMYCRGYEGSPKALRRVGDELDLA